MRSDRKNPKSDLRNYYTVFLELGMVVVLVLFLVAMKLNIKTSQKKQKPVEKQEVVQMEDVVQTKQVDTPPPPPRPQVPVEVPNDQVIKEQKIQDTEIDFDQPLTMPAPEGDKGPAEKVFVAVENPPKLKGGLGALQKKINYPEAARRSGVEGRVIIQFVVNKEGKVTKPKVIRGIGAGCDKEALRVVKQAEFTPGRQRGVPVKVQYSLPIVFRLQN